jgi:hypothetical protein
MRPLPLKVLYTTTELAHSLGISKHTLLELARMRDIVVYRLERTTLVPLSELRDKLEPVWEAIRAAEQARGRDDRRNEGTEGPRSRFSANKSIHRD